MFLRGILGNLQEKEWHNFLDYAALNASGRLCPVYFCSWCGLFLVMPRCQPLLRSEYFTEQQYKEFTGASQIFYESGGVKRWFTLGGLPVEWKPDSFGKLPTGEIVAIDYG
jgi:hypothetical protein